MERDKGRGAGGRETEGERDGLYLGVDEGSDATAP